MEGSSRGGATVVDHADPKVWFEAAKLPVKSAAAWHKSGFRLSGNFKRDVAAAKKYWQVGGDLLAKLPNKSKRSPAQKLAADFILSACRQAREDFLQRHADILYRKLTKNLADFVRVDDLVYGAARLVPGLTPTRNQLDAESPLMQAEKEGVEVDQGIFLSQVLALPDAGMHLCKSMLLPKHEALERRADLVKGGTIDFGPARVERQGKAAVVTVCNPRFLNAEDDNTLGDTETAADIAMLDPMSEICVLRGSVVDHPRYRGRKIFSAGINLTHLYRGKIPYLWYIRRDMGIVNKMFRGLALVGSNPDEIYGG